MAEQERHLSGQETRALHPLHEEALGAGVENCVQFEELSEAALLHNLRQRFKQDRIYT